MRCHYFEANRCRSCTLIETPYSTQLHDKTEYCRELLPQVPKWLPAFTGGDRAFRNRVKLVVGGSASEVTLGILGPDRQGIDLRECAIQAPEIAEVIPAIADFLESTGLEPYDVPARRGELKFVHITVAPEVDGVSSLMVRFVVRTEHALGVIRAALSRLRAAVPSAAVISVNLLPEHKAVLEGEREEMLLGSSLPMRLGFESQPLTLHLMPQSFFQTNTAVARELYSQVSAWAADIQPSSLWDLYCGVGGFALHCAAAMSDKAFAAQPSEKSANGVRVLGVELSEAAIDSAKRSARDAGLNAKFVAADATEYALSAQPGSLPEMLVVNPPRRGIGAELASWIETSGIATVVYSSCNPESLARDLAVMPSYVVREGRVFDMFPHTSHLEVAVLLQRRA
ncbi:methyltransferase domain-containing protein [Leucobacter sp. UT-8R-CII-1-4]|uniref:methyltransferase domain-containing protein n=1 Tax=Leucobacter sp. UT-8R-CII-1-4 TaxID=3040075 RepID=UPI0024A99CBB|nr:methyltransferase domain-containing protein [Leucobacter sp. UT-8R-CII-1-4]MDI6023121.1 methyltransferase domain-containing protein [Leucobacter sp. UT-8R-CII-1-4]